VKYQGGGLLMSCLEYMYKVAVVFFIMVICTPMLSSCGTIKQFSVKTSNVSKAKHRLKKIFQEKQPTTYKLNYIQQKNQLVLTDLVDVYVVNLNSGDFDKSIKDAASSIVEYTHITRNGDYLYQFTTSEVNIYDAKTWEKIKTLDKGIPINQISGISNSEDLFYFAGVLWSSDTLEKKYDLNDVTAIPTDLDFSPDDKLLLISDGVADTVLFDIENNKYKDMSYRKEDTSQVDFRDNSSFYASYGATFDITKGGYLPEKLGLFDISDDRFISKFSPYGKISCWVHDKEHGLLVTLLNGDIYLLDHLLDIQHKWHINDYIKTCGQGANGDIWLGSVKTGLYKASFREKTLTREYPTNKTINSVEASLDGRYLGITEAFHGQTKVTVFAVD
jgi:hypothetical protein